jgi:hypothetical protein
MELSHSVSEDSLDAGGQIYNPEAMRLRVQRIKENVERIKQRMRITQRSNNGEEGMTHM